MRARRTGTVRATAVSFGALVLIAPALASPSSAAEERQDTTRSVTPSTRAVDDELLDGPARGRTAIAELGDQIGLAAARNDLRVRDLKTMLVEDRTLWLDSHARLYAIDPAPEPPPGRGTTDSSRRAPDAATPAPLADTFALHSNPDATRKIFIDVDGGTVTGTWWNSESGVAATHPAWDPAGNGPSFTDDELARVQKIWAMIAEDYAPWQVDVTTADPGVAGLTRSDAADPTYGTHALVTPSADAWSRICQSRCGGVAYLGTFGDTGTPTPSQPAWIFPQALGDDAKAIAEAVSHEVGHNLALTHDGNATQGYDTGHGAWAPIMGVGYDRPITQWSQGSYVGADNPQDDLSVITGFLARRPDEAGATAATAAALPAAGVASFITDRSDVDAFDLGACGAGATATIAPAATSPNLDVRAGVVDHAGAVVATADPASALVDREYASGLGATVPVPAGSTSTLLVDGTGNGDWSAGYDDYASLGAYTVAVDGCTADATVPSAPTDVTATAGATDPTITLTWAPPTSTGSGAVTGYRVTRLDTGESTLLGAQARSFVLGGLAPGTRYDLSVAALNAAGSGPVATAGATTYDPTTVPGAPREPTAVWNADPDRVLLRWAAPADDGGDAVTTYAIGLDGVNRGSVSAAYVAVNLAGPFSIGTHTVTVRAVNAVGSGPAASVTFDVAAPPANDDVDAARVLTGAAGSTSATTYGATGAVDDPVPPGSDLGAGRHSVWFAWTAPSRAPVRFATSATSSDTAASRRDTTLAVFTGSRGDLTPVASNDDHGGAGLFSAVDLTPVPGVRYLLAVDSFSSVGAAGPFALAWSSTEVAPTAPVGITAVRGDGSALVRWTASDPGTQPVTQWVVTANPGGRQLALGGSTTSATVDGLVNGTAYRFSVQAISPAGTSPASALSAAVTPAGIPLTMARPRARVKNRTVTVTWAPATENGDPVTGYRILVSGARSRTAPASATRLVVRRMRPGRYAVRVQATNDVGTSPASAPLRIVVRR